MKNGVAFPKGLSNFRDLVLEGFYYVDKTPYIERLENSGEKLISFLRPRKIGKSLFVSVLEYYYGQEHQAQFQDIFGKYYIGQNPSPLANRFAVLKMDFSGIDVATEERAYQGFLRKIKTYTDEFQKRYQCFSESERANIQNQASPEGVIEKFFTFYQGSPIYFILDEYDHFTNEILVKDLRQFKKAVAHEGYVRKFYEVLKTASQQGIVNRIFITGVSPVTLDALTSGFNVITHLTNELAFHDMIGFTKAEVGTMVDLILGDPSRKDQIMQDLADWYNGYRFHEDSGHQIYNSNMVLYFCSHFQHYQAYPKQMLDPNIAPDYGKLKKMFEIKNPEGNYATLEKILYQGEVTENLIYQFSFDVDFSDAQLISFLYYLGYLTIKGEARGQILFGIPNHVIKKLYWEYFAWLISKREQLPYDEHQIRERVGEMTVGNLGPFLEVIQKVLGTLSDRDYQNFDEKYIKVVLISYLALANIYHIKSEPEQRKGYPDLLLVSPPSVRSIDKEYILELKYLKKKEATEKKIAETKQAAQAQILKYIAHDISLRQNPKLLAYVLVFVKDEILMEEVEF